MTEGSDLKKEVLPPTDGSMEKKSKESKKIMRSRKIKESEEGQENKGTKEKMAFNRTTGRSVNL